MSTVGAICPECAEERKRKVQESISRMNMDALVGLHVKKAFSTGMSKPMIEHMWVRVLMVNKEEKNLSGYLDNDPVFVKDLQYRSGVTVAFSEIEDIYP